MKEIDSLHVEITSRCNAKCPMCSRTNNPKILNNLSEIKYNNFVKFFPPEFISKLKKLKFCGNFGDPAIATDLIEIHKYIFEHNKDLIVSISTNGGVRNESFWTKLGEIYATNPKSFVEFHIDGLEDTNHIYRDDVKWSKLMNNAKAFIKTGANAKWFFIPFFHNEHQVEQAEKLSDQMGFSEFILKISARFESSKKPFRYTDHKGNDKSLYPPTADRFYIDDMQVKGPLICLHKQRKEIYVDSWGYLFPCCWTASLFHKDNNWSIKRDKYNISLHFKTIDEILSSKIYNDWLETMYANDKSVCHRRCTGSKIHVLEKNNVKKLQKDLWYTEEERELLDVN